VMEMLAAESEMVGHMADQWLGTIRNRRKAATFEELPVALQRKSLRTQLLEFGIVPDYDLVERLRTEANTDVTVPKIGVNRSKSDRGLSMFRTSAGMLEMRPPVAQVFSTANLEVELTAEGQVGFGGIDIEWRI